MPKYLVLQYHDLYNLLSDILAKKVYTQREGEIKQLWEKINSEYRCSLSLSYNFFLGLKFAN